MSQHDPLLTFNEWQALCKLTNDCECKLSSCGSRACLIDCPYLALAFRVPALARFERAYDENGSICNLAFYITSAGIEYVNRYRDLIEAHYNRKFTDTPMVSCYSPDR